MKITSVSTRILLFVFVAGLAVSSCKKDSSSTITVAGGTWTAGTPNFTAMIGTKTITQYYTDVMGLTPAEAAQNTAIVNLLLMQAFTGTILFKSDNTYTSNLGGVADSGTWSLSADGKKLTIDSNTDVAEILDVTVLTSNKLTVSTSGNVYEDLNSDGTDETIAVHVEIPFTR